ncbi:hypothetical protein E2562_003523 [Oryza meyeriana var. granulata]|uniref:Uncharacterized protein n=1 Tax=Oryza meyeriana var. granulata TaxID=110450 RepID=A0A6G1CLK7_9ORYZ|nr:hypothetical protein E2562_003523 [Oryza meyeriana var. granulata]
MEQFHDGHHVWLRSRVHGTYLRADDDGSSVSLHQVRASVHAAWAVHILHLDGGDILMLQSAANGRYLAATNAWARNSVTLHDLNRLPSLTVGWFAVRSGSEDDVLLRHTSGRFLRADDRNLIVDMFDGRRPITRQWVVEAIPPRDSIPNLPYSSTRAFISGCRISYVRASPQGNFSPTAWRWFLFNGRSVFYLRNRLAGHLGFRVASDVIMCVRAGFFGRLTPLVTDLPPNNVTMEIVVLTARTIGLE